MQRNLNIYDHKMQTIFWNDFDLAKVYNYGFP